MFIFQLVMLLLAKARIGRLLWSYDLVLCGRTTMGMKSYDIALYSRTTLGLLSYDHESRGLFPASFIDGKG